MRKNIFFRIFLLLALSIYITGCSNSDETELGNENYLGDYLGLTRELCDQEPLWANNDFGFLDTSNYKTEEGTTWLWHDNYGRVTSIMLYIPALMDINVLYQSPSSVNELNGMYYQLDSDNELRLYNSGEFEGEVNDFNTSGMPSGFEYYHQYHKGVRVSGAGYTVNYYITPQGKRIAYANGRLLTDLTVDTTPNITAGQAKHIYATRLGNDVEKDWEAELMVKEYIIRKNGEDVRDERLIWHVKGTVYPKEEAWQIVMTSNIGLESPLRHEAQIDAHTGRLLVEGHSLSLMFI
jgi:hypothetical protein